MATCEYEEWSPLRHKLERCGEEGAQQMVKNKMVVLCPAHYEFVKDAVNDYEVRLANLTRRQKKERLRAQIKALQQELKLC